MNLKIKFLLSFVITYVTACAQGNWKLVVDENFTADSINYNIWSDQYGWGRSIVTIGDRNYYSPKNIKTENGLLMIYGRKENVTARIIEAYADTTLLEDKKPNLRESIFTTGMVRYKKQVQYGKFEIRCKMPYGKDTYAAFWLWGNREIDVFEQPWKYRSRFFTNHHYADSTGRHRQAPVFYNYGRPRLLTKAFHTYTLEWMPGVMKWYFDGKLISTVNKDFNDYMDVMVTLAIISRKFSAPDPETIDWQEVKFEVDYFKIWEYVPGN